MTKIFFFDGIISLIHKQLAESHECCSNTIFLHMLFQNSCGSPRKTNWLLGDSLSVFIYAHEINKKFLKETHANVH